MARNTAATNIVLPRSVEDPETWTTIVIKSKALRLFSLQTAPEAFSSTYTRESTFTYDIWEDRLRNPLATTIVAVADNYTGQNDIELLTRGKWVGIIVLIGPKEEPFVPEDRSLWQKSPPDGAASTHGSSLTVQHVHLNAVFIDPEYRGRGLANGLIKDALRVADVGGRERGAEKIRATILVDKDNIAASKLYQKLGFTIVKEETFLPPRKETADETKIAAYGSQIYLMEHWSNG